MDADNAVKTNNMQA